MSKSIPKIIHYCWFGRGELPNLAIKCIESWEKYFLYPKTYFCPLMWNSNKTDFTEKTFTIHHFAGSWHDEKVIKTKKSILWRITGRYVVRLVTLLKKLLENQNIKL